MSWVRRACAWPMCPNVAEQGQARCAEHERQQKRQKDSRRANSNQRGYTYRYLQARKQALLKSRGLCVFCLAEDPPRYTLAVEVHHRLPVSVKVDHSQENLAPTCLYHHRQQHGLEYDTAIDSLPQG